MQIRVYIDEKETILELFNITYEVSEDRFKSLRLSHGCYPNFVMLDYKDQSVDIKNNFIVDQNDIQTEMKEHFKHIKTMLNNEEEQVLKENWFCWTIGTPVFDILEWFSNYKQ